MAQIPICYSFPRKEHGVEMLQAFIQKLFINNAFKVINTTHGFGWDLVGLFHWTSLHFYGELLVVFEERNGNTRMRDSAYNSHQNFITILAFILLAVR